SGATILPLVASGRASGRQLKLLLELFRDGARAADRVDLLLDLLGPLLDPLVGDFFVVEDHELANGPVAAVQLIAELDHLSRDERRPRDRLDDCQLAALDAPRDFDLAFAGQQR